MKRFLSRHPALWRLALSLLAVFLSGFLILTAMEWPTLTAAGSAARLARENGVHPAQILLTKPSDCELVKPYLSSLSPDAWTLAFDGEQYQIAQLNQRALGLLWSPWRCRNTYREALNDPFQIVTPSDAIPLQYRPALAREGLTLKGAPIDDSNPSTQIYTEYLALVFASPGIVRVEAWQQTLPRHQEPDWSSYHGVPIAGALLIDGVWELRYLESRNNDHEVHTRIVGYNTSGELVEAVFAPPPPFA